ESEEASREAGSAPDETGAAPPEEGPAPARHEIPARPEQKVPPAGSQPPPQPPARKYRVFNIKGGVIMSQDGERFRYRKTCPKCGHQDRSITSGPIQPGTTRSHFFCPKCRKNHPVEVH